MTTYRTFPDLAAAIDAHAWDDLSRNHERYAAAVERAVDSGGTPEDIRQSVLAASAKLRGGLLDEIEALANQIEAAARHLRRQREAQ